MPQTESGLIKNVVIGIVIFAACAGIGFFVSSGGSSKPGVAVLQSTQSDQPLAQQDKPTTVATTTTSKDQNADYVAPGAPNIEIKEEKNPILTVRDSQPNSPSDSLSPDLKSSSPIQNNTPAQDASNGANSKIIGVANDSVPKTDVSPSTSASQATPSSGTAVDPDFENVGNADSESNQQGTPTNSTTPSYRVQAGAFADDKNARILVDELRAKGYPSMLRSDRAGDVTEFRVQTGIFKSHRAAEIAAAKLQRDGFPATVSPVNP